MTRSPLIPLSVIVHWTEAGSMIAEDDEVLAFPEFERRALRAAMSHRTGGYLKTKVTVDFADAEDPEGLSRYGCRIDLAAHDELGFEHGIGQRIAFYDAERDRKMADWCDEMKAYDARLRADWWGRMRFDPKIEVGARIRAHGHDGTIVAMPGESASHGYIPQTMVAVRLPGGVTLTSVFDIERPAPQYATELTPEGEQTVIPGCERAISPWARGAQQYSLF